jgi:mannose-6-phosphate isomerase-like protein (cupin superfamily)
MRQFELSCCGIKVSENQIPYKCRSCGSTSFHQFEVDKRERVISTVSGYSGDSKQEVRPWGSFKILLDEKGCKVKKITVNPKSRLSLQLHQHRCEWWKIISGEGLMQVGSNEWVVKQWDTVTIDKLQVHRITNETDMPVTFVEIQTGVCEEDDIVRVEDDYGRLE